MNKKVFNYIIILLWFILIVFSILKVFFSEWFIAVVENKRIEELGKLIDNNIILKVMFETVLGAFAMHFYLCACKQEWKLAIREYVLIAVYSVVITLMQFWLPQLGIFINFIAPIVMPVILKCKWKQTLVIFVLHHIGQLLTLFIKSKELYLVSTNSATTLILTFDVYIWLCLYYTYSNFYKEETLWDYLLSSFSGIKQKMSSRKSSKE